MGQGAEYQMHKLSQEVERLTAENERLSLENQSLREKIVAAGYSPNHDTEEIKEVELWLKARSKQNTAEIARLTEENQNLIERGDKLNRDTQFYEAWVDKKLERLTGLEKENARLQSVAQLRFDRAEQLHEKNVELQAENARLTAALVECQEAFESGREVGERTAEV